MKKITMALAVGLFLMTGCNDNEEPKATLSIDAPEEVTFNADGSAGVSEITVTTNQSEWDYQMDPTDGAGWVTPRKEGDKLYLTATPNTELTAPESVTITFTAGDAPEKQVVLNQLGADGERVYRVDDFWPNEETPQGIVFYIDPASSTDGGVSGTSGWVMSLKQSGIIQWTSNRYMQDYGTNSDIDGRLNWDAIWDFDAANPEYTDTFEAFKWVRDNFDEGWYIPSLQEMRRFVAAYTGLTDEEIETYMSGRRLSSLDQIFGKDKWYSTEEYRKAYDMRMIEAGGDGMWNWDVNSGSTDPQLWTSTKYDEDIPAIEVYVWYTGFLGDWGSSSTAAQDNGHLVRAMLRFGPETVSDMLSIDPGTLSFEAKDESVKTINVTYSASEYNATTSSEWVHITKTATSFTVSVDEYTTSQAADVNFSDREASILVSSGNAPASWVVLTQRAPANGDTPLDLAGKWKYEGDIWEYGQLLPKTDTLTAEYNEELGVYLFKGLFENQAMTGLVNPDDLVYGGVALKVLENNQVQFVVLTPVDIYFDMWAMGMFRGYYNYATFFDSANGNVVGATGLPTDTAINFGVSADGNTITFPKTGTYENQELNYGFGFGYMDIVSMEDHTISPTSSPLQAGGVYLNLVFTRVTE